MVVWIVVGMGLAFLLGFSTAKTLAGLIDLIAEAATYDAHAHQRDETS